MCLTLCQIIPILQLRKLRVMRWVRRRIWTQTFLTLNSICSDAFNYKLNLPRVSIYLLSKIRAFLSSYSVTKDSCCSLVILPWIKKRGTRGPVPIWRGSWHVACKCYLHQNQSSKCQTGKSGNWISHPKNSFHWRGWISLSRMWVCVLRFSWESAAEFGTRGPVFEFCPSLPTHGDVWLWTTHFHFWAFISSTETSKQSPNGIGPDNLSGPLDFQSLIRDPLGLFLPWLVYG